MSKVKPHRYTPDEICFLKQTIPGKTRSEIALLFFEQFNIALTLNQVKAFCVKHSFYSGLTGLNKRVPIGTERIDVDGYTAIKIAHPSKWERKHRFIWEQEYGSIPKGYAVIFANGDRSDFSLKNLVLVSFKEMAVLNKRGLIFSNSDATKSGLQVVRIMMARSQAQKRKQ